MESDDKDSKDPQRSGAKIMVHKKIRRKGKSRSSSPDPQSAPDEISPPHRETGELQVNRTSNFPRPAVGAATPEMESGGFPSPVARDSPPPAPRTQLGMSGAFNARQEELSTGFFDEPELLEDDFEPQTESFDDPEIIRFGQSEANDVDFKTFGESAEMQVPGRSPPSRASKPRKGRSTLEFAPGGELLKYDDRGQDAKDDEAPRDFVDLASSDEDIASPSQSADLDDLDLYGDIAKGAPQRSVESQEAPIARSQALNMDDLEEAHDFFDESLFGDAEPLPDEGGRSRSPSEAPFDMLDPFADSHLGLEPGERSLDDFDPNDDATPTAMFLQETSRARTEDSIAGMEQRSTDSLGSLDSALSLEAEPSEDPFPWEPEAWDEEFGSAEDDFGADFGLADDLDPGMDRELAEQLEEMVATSSAEYVAAVDGGEESIFELGAEHMRESLVIEGDAMGPADVYAQTVGPPVAQAAARRASSADIQVQSPPGMEVDFDPAPAPVPVPASTGATRGRLKGRPSGGHPRYLAADWGNSSLEDGRTTAGFTKSFEIDVLLEQVVDLCASTLTLSTGARPLVKVRAGGAREASLETVPHALVTMASWEQRVRPITRPVYWEQLVTTGRAAFLHTTSRGVTFRVLLVCHGGGYCATFSRLYDANLPLAELRLPAVVQQLAHLSDGLVLVMGGPRAGVSTTMAGLIHALSRERAAHIITIEEPIEFVYTGGAGVIHQREIGMHTSSMLDAVADAMLQSPDVIVIREPQTAEELEAMLKCAASGTLVLSTVCASDAEEGIARLSEHAELPEQSQVTQRLMDVLRVVVCQKLVPTREDSIVPVASVTWLSKGDWVFDSRPTVARQADPGLQRGLSMNESVMTWVKRGVVDRSAVSDIIFDSTSPNEPNEPS